MNGPLEFNEDVVRLCTRILTLITDSHKTILLTGVSERDPVGQVAYELARTLVLLGDGPVLLVDANFSPKSNQTGSRPGDQSPGLLEVLRQGTQLSDAVVLSDLPGLTFLSSGSTGSTEKDFHALLLSDQCSELLKEMRQDFAFVIIESAPIMAHSECLRLAATVDGAAVVAEAGQHQQKELSELKQTMSAFRLPILGIIFSTMHGKKILR